MALSFDMDIYNWLLSEILKVNPTGDPVNDAVYLVLLPMVVLYLFVFETVGKSRFANGKMGGGKVQLIIMFIMGFFIVREGYYPLFAGFSLPLLIIIMLYHTLSFIFGRKESEGAPNKAGGSVSQPGSGGSSHFWNRLFHPVTNRMAEAAAGFSFATWDKAEFVKEAGILSAKWDNEDRVVTTRTSTFGSQDDSVKAALSRQEEIENELARLALGARQKNISLDTLLDEKLLGKNLDHLKRRIQFRLNVNTG